MIVSNTLVYHIISDINHDMSDSPKQPVSRELFEKWLPIFKAGEEAKKKLSEDESKPENEQLNREEKAHLRKQVSDGENAFVILYNRIMKVADKIIQTELDRPRAFHVLIEREDLEAAAYEGIYAALLKLDIEKMKKSNLNLIMQYVSTKVSREALRMEASVGMSPSKLRLYKKIAAVRRSLKDQIGRDPTDEEVLDYFHSGKADYKTMNGKTDSNLKPYKVNTTIKLKDIQGQRELDNGHPFHSPVTDEREIDASISVDNNDFTELEDNKAAEKMFWVDYMNYIGINEQEQSIIADELKLYELPRAQVNTTGYDDSQCKQLARDFLKLIQHRKGRIQQFAIMYTSKHGDGFWRVFAEDLRADAYPKFEPKNNSLVMKLLKPANI